MSIRLLLAFVLGFGLIILTAKPARAIARSVGAGRPMILISDIDDTIKRTNVLSTRGVILNGPRTTNVFRGMNDLYVLFACDTVVSSERNRCLARQGLTMAQNRKIVYVTAARGRLQMFGNLFLKNSGFPIGLFIGREQTDTDLADSVSGPGPDLSEGYPNTLEYKIETVKKLMQDYREFDFVLVGDNGEKDVAAYDAVQKWAARNLPQIRVHTFIHQVYDWREGVSPATNQTLYVTGGDLAIEFFRRGLLSERALANSIDQTLKAIRANDEDVFPGFLDCRPILSAKRFPKVPDNLSASTAARAELMLVTLKKYCSR